MAAIRASEHSRGQVFPVSPPTSNFMNSENDEIKSDDAAYNVRTSHNDHASHANATSAPTPPTTDEGSHKDDDNASSSSLSDLDDNIVDIDDFDEAQNRQRYEDAARAGAEAEQHARIKPHHYEGGVPVFQPTMDEFRDFQAFMAQADAYGMQSGIIKIIPPDEWKAARKALDDLVKHIKIKNPLTQEFHGAQGIYTQRNMEKVRSYNLPQWKALCEQTDHQPPARRGEKRKNADTLLGRGAARKKNDGTPGPDGEPKRRGRGAKKREGTTEPDTSNVAAPPTPTSPEAAPVAIKVEDDETESLRDQTPVPAKAAKKPRGRPPKNGVKRETGSGRTTETTVAARRLRNAREAVDYIDEEAFEHFDYRAHDNDQWTQERCDELEDKYWKSMSYNNPMYAADMPGSLFDEDTKEWNVAKLPNLLDWLGAPIPGVNTAYLYLGMWKATFAWHLEDVDLYSINYIHFGAPKQWYSISQNDAPKFEQAMKTYWPQDAKDCDQFLRHKTYLVSPSILKAKHGVQVNKVIHREGEFVITFPIGYHSGYNLGYNCAESVNFAIENWLQYGKSSRKCQCEADSVFIDVDWFIRRMNGEPSPEFEEVEITDDEDDESLGTPVPGAGRGKSAQKRKRGGKDSGAGPNKKAKKIVKIRKISKVQPCCLCPNDFACYELLPTSNGLQAHRVCAMYTPETYIATEDGAEKVFNVENISKARLELRCHECKQKKGSCFQCSSAKCTRAYHATCAMHAGVQVDKGEIAIWHEGVEYRDIGFDWRCKLHRTVKRTRITSELSTFNHAEDWLKNKEMHEHIISLVPGDVIQWQAFHGDEILAGVVTSKYDPGQNSVLVSVLPDQKMIREIDPAWILFVDSSTSCLQRPSAKALELPEDLQGKTAQVPGSTNKKPSAGDPFTEEPNTVHWAEFVVEPPPHNKWQKAVDFEKEKQLLYFLPKSSTETKAQYTADVSKPIHDPSCDFLAKVEPIKMAPPPQPRRQSLVPSPSMNVFAARNAAMQAVSRREGTQLAASSLSKTPLELKSEALMNAARFASQNLSGKIQQPQHNDLTTAAEAKANEQARILQRQQASASTQYTGQGSFQASVSGMNIDQSAVARQKQFQQQAAQQARSLSTSSQQSSPHHSPPLPLYTTSSPMPGYRPYHNITPNYYNNSPRYGSFTPSSMQYTHDWMSPTGPHPQSPLFPSPAMPVMESNSPELAFKQPAKFVQSPSAMQNRPMVASSASPPLAPQQHNPSQTAQSSAPRLAGPPSQQSMQPGQPFLGVSAVSRGAGGTTDPPTLKKEASSIDSTRTVLSSLAPPRTPTELERQRRISNPSWPFKSPEQIMAQKGEREKNGSQSSGSRPVSRPGSGYSTKAFPSPRLHASPYGPEPQTPMYINPNVTQMPGPAINSISHSRAKSMSVSAGVGNMGPPSSRHPSMPGFRRTMSSSNLTPMDLDTKQNIAILRQQLLRESDRDYRPVFGPHPMPPPSRSRRSTMNSSAGPIVEAPIEPPSPQLQDSLGSRPATRSGSPVNDRPPPAAIVSWTSHPGFWGKVASYFLRKHESSATVYKSPFGVVHRSDQDLPSTAQCPSGNAVMRMQGASTIGNDDGLAGRWLTDLETPNRGIVEHWRSDHPLGMRP